MEINEQEIQEYNNTIEFLDSQIERLIKVVGELQQTRNFVSNARDNAMSAYSFYSSGALSYKEITDLVEFIKSNPKTTRQDLRKIYRHLSIIELNYLIRNAKMHWLYIENGGLKNTHLINAPLLFQT